MRLIDADTLIKTVEGLQDCYNGFSDTYDKACIIGVIDEQPTIDAVPVVRCKDCEHKVTTEDGEYNPHDIVCAYWDSDGLEETDFCSYGERRTDE